MTWLVFGVSCLLVLAGAVSIISGAPIIQLERGWAEVISGTVALASGGVVFALAGILMRLEAIRDAVAARTLPVAAEAAPLLPAVSAPASPAPAPIVAEPVPAPEPLAPPAADPTGTEDDERREGLWKRVKRPPVEQQDAEALQRQGFPDRAVPDEQPGARPVQSAPVVVPAHDVVVPEPFADVPAADMASRPATGPERQAGQIGWLERSLFKGRGARADDSLPDRTEPDMIATPVERAGLPFGLAPVEAPSLSGPASRPAPEAVAEPDPTPDLQAEQHGGATVIGRYQAGSAAYVMYSDGTIEVETESGEMHRFGSMEELKAFIAQQDTPVS